MPTAAEFESYREQFETLRSAVTEEDGFLTKGWDDAIKGGSLEQTVKEALESSTRMTKAIVSAFDELRSLCNERKILCDEWDAARAAAKSKWDSDYAAWKHDPVGNAFPGSEPAWPPAPGTWATPSMRY